MAGARGSARRQLVGRLLGGRNRRRGPGPSRVRIVALRALPGVVALALLVFAWPATFAAVRGHRYFAVREVLVRNTRRLAADRVRDVARIVPGMSIWDVDPAAAEDRLRVEPWIRAARVRRHLPHRVVIAVREHRPVAILAVKDPRPALYYVAAHGRIFAPVTPRGPHDFPYVTGLGARDLTPGATIGPRALRRALALVRVANRARGVESVSEVHVDPVRGLTLMPVRPPVPIEVGWGGWDRKLARLPPVLKLWAGRLDDVAAVSLVFGDDVIVRTKTDKPRPATARARKA